MTPEELAKQIGDLEKLVKAKRRLMTRIVLTVESYSKAEAPVRTGHLRRTITHQVSATGDRGVVGTNVNYAKPVHDGSKAYDIRPKNKKALAFKSGGSVIFTKKVHMPARTANPFFTRGLAASRDMIEQFMTEAGEEYLGSLIK